MKPAGQDASCWREHCLRASATEQRKLGWRPWGFERERVEERRCGAFVSPAITGDSVRPLGAQKGFLTGRSHSRHLIQLLDELLRDSMVVAQ
jgi:hypothetical protein